MEKISKNMFDVIVFGSGPAGLETAIYTSAAKFKTLVLGKKENSRLFKAHLISNYFGFPKGISGKELLEKGINQAKKTGVSFLEEEAIDVFKEDNYFKIITAKGDYLSKSILLATGVKNSSSGILNEEKLIGRGISFCVACDGLYFQNKKIGVLGEGDFSAKEALELLKYTKDVTIYTNGKDFNARKDFQKEINKNKIKLDNNKIKEFFGEEKLGGIIFENKKKINLDGMFIAKGSPKASDFSYKLGIDIVNDYIKCDRQGKTNIEGVFSAGDVIGLTLQVSYAVGSGAMTAFSIMEFLNKGNK